MQFTTKHEIHEHVWFMKNNKALEVIITSVKISKIGNEDTIVTYTASGVDRPGKWLEHQDLHEPNVFKTKEELLASL